MQALAESVPDAGGVMVVPAFTGLGAPYWKPDARGTITGLTRGSTVAHIARAALESIAFQSAALLQAMSRDAVAAGGAAVAELRVDGGACVNDLLMQFQADLLGIPVVRPAVIETTALGAAYLAGLATGVYQSTDELAALWRAERRFLPTLQPQRAQELMERWEHAVRQTVLIAGQTLLSRHDWANILMNQPAHCIHRRRQHGQRHHRRADRPRPLAKPYRRGGTVFRGRAN